VLAVSLIATPFTIRLLGPSLYGLWSLLQVSMVWVVLADLGMATASTKFATERYANDDQPGEVAVIWTALSITVAVTACAACVIGLMAPAIASHVLHVRGSLLGPGVLALRIVCPLFVFQAVTGIVNTPQVVRLRWRGYTLVTTGANLVGVVGAPVALALAAGGIVTVTFVMLCGAVLAAVGNLLLAVRLLPRLIRPYITLRLLPRLLTYGGGLTVSGLAMIPLTTAQLFLLAHNRSTVVVAYYAVAAALGTVLTVLPTALVAPLLPGLVGLASSGRLDEYRILYRKGLQGLFLVLLPGGALLAFVAYPFLSLWAGPEYGRYSTGPFFVILAGGLCNSLAYVPYSHLLASGRTGTIARIHVAELVPYLLAAAGLTAKFGAMGAATAWSGRVMVDAVAFFIVARRTSGLHWSPLPARRVASLAAPLALAAALAALAPVISGLSGRVSLAVGLAVVYALGVWKGVLTEPERHGLATLGSELMPRLRKSAHA
jgi:O-antigen/teichoic acid export membrane protein